MTSKLCPQGELLLQRRSTLIRVFKLSRRLAQVNGYFKHLRRVLFVFQKVIVILEEINKRQVMKIINKQCSYYMYLLIFEDRAFLAGKSTLVHGL